MPASSLRIGISGFGRLAREYYVPILRGMEGATLVAVADPLDDSRRAATRLCDVPTYADVRAMCATEDLQAMLVASPPSSHLDGWHAARERGLSAFLEKPLGLVSQLRSLPQLSDSEARIMLNFNRRFWPEYIRCSESVAAGRLGKLERIELVLQTNVRRWSTVTQHRLSDTEGGVLHDLGSQAVDVVSQIAGGEPMRISASRSVQASGFEQIEMEMEFPGGARAHCKLGYGENNRECLVVMGTEKSMILREPNMKPHIVNRQGRLRVHHYLEDYAALGSRFIASRERMLYYTMSKALRQFIDSLRAGSQQSPAYSEGVANLRVLARASEAIETATQVTHD